MLTAVRFSIRALRPIAWHFRPVSSVRFQRFEVLVDRSQVLQRSSTSPYPHWHLRYYNCLSPTPWRQWSQKGQSLARAHVCRDYQIRRSPTQPLAPCGHDSLRIDSTFRQTRNSPRAFQWGTSILGRVNHAEDGVEIAYRATVWRVFGRRPARVGFTSKSREGWGSLTYGGWNTHVPPHSPARPQPWTSTSAV